jgi:hypothetical protein
VCRRAGVRRGVRLATRAFFDASQFSRRAADSLAEPVVARVVATEVTDQILESCSSARECRRERGMMPNLIAIDFYRTGDLLDVVDAMNGIQKRATAAP